MTHRVDRPDAADGDRRGAVREKGSRRGRSGGPGRSHIERRRLLVALFLSAVAHALILGVRIGVRAADAGSAWSRTGQAGPAGTVMRAIDLVIAPDAVSSSDASAKAVASSSPDEPDLVDRAPAERSPVNPAGAEAGRPADGDARSGLSERLAPRMTDRRLWFDPVPAARADGKDAARVREPIRERVAALNDSIAAEAERKAESRDWTARDEEGGRWGISPDRVHLGGLTVKLRYCTVEPCRGWLFPTPADRKDEYENRERGFAEIRLQASRAVLDEALAARATAIRKRLDAQRDSSRGGGLDPFVR